MTDTVRHWMSSPVIVIDRDCSVSYALTLMRQRNIHSLIVSLEPEQAAYGIVTSTDIRDKILAADRNPAETRISDIMTSPILTASPEWTLQECSQHMHAHNIHHMPVADEHGTLVGLISATDLFVAAEERGWGRER